jgi:hypothetical protein
MAFSEAERTEIRRFCGYPAYGSGTAGYQGWRYYQAYGLMEFRLSHMTGSEETVARKYIAALETLESALAGAGETLDTAVAAVWTRNPKEIADRTRLFDDWRRRLCGFLGLPAGPDLGERGLRLVV